MQKLTRLAFVLSTLVFAGTGVANVEGASPAQELRFETIFATKPHDPATYIVLGSGYLRALSTRTEKEFIKHWLEIHPHATVTPISTCNPMRPDRPPARFVYVWIEDGAESLNVSLIEEGIFSGGVMLDMVESQQRTMESMRDPTLTAVRKQLEAELAAQPEADRVKRLISDADYADRRKRIEAAEHKARDKKKGIWSDAMKEERQAEGIE